VCAVSTAPIRGSSRTSAHSRAYSASRLIVSAQNGSSGRTLSPASASRSRLTLAVSRSSVVARTATRSAESGDLSLTGFTEPPPFSSW
jgi:hypothetical protein